MSAPLPPLPIFRAAHGSYVGHYVPDDCHVPAPIAEAIIRATAPARHAARVESVRGHAAALVSWLGMEGEEWQLTGWANVILAAAAAAIADRQVGELPGVLSTFPRLGEASGRWRAAMLAAPLRPAWDDEVSAVSEALARRADPDAALPYVLGLEKQYDGWQQDQAKASALAAACAALIARCAPDVG